MATVLAVFAHPDDEAWAAAGTLARLADHHRVVIAAATAGEAGVDRRPPEDAARQPLAEARRREFAASCAVIGAEPRVLGLPDGALEDLGPAAVEALVDELEPALVVTLGDDGGYGHRDHLAVTGWLRALAHARGIPLATAVFPPELFRPIYRALKKTGIVKAGLQTLGGEPAVRVTIDPAVRVAALACHRSQFRGGPMSLLPGLEQLTDVEGWDVTGASPLDAIVD